MNINTKEFGKVVFIKQEESPVGIMLREYSTGVVLERYYKEGGVLKSEVLRNFEGPYLRCSVDLRECLKKAREYEKDLKVPVYVDIWSGTCTNETHEFFWRKKLKYTDENLMKEFRSLANKIRQ